MKSRQFLRDLWRKQAHILAGIVAKGGRDHRQIAHAARLISEDYHGRFLIELIQNANDQAVRGHTLDSTVVIVRSHQPVAVSNGGESVTKSSLDRLISLADSDKTGDLVGNKGVGFKAVYQVTDGPEVYSAPDGDPAASVFDALALGFALERQPFDNRILHQEVECDIRQYFAENDGLARELRNTSRQEDATQAVLPELKEGPGFSFPVCRTPEDLRGRLEELQFPNELREGVRTLVVLPLRDRDKDASKISERVVDQLVGEGPGGRAQAELAVLFLTGVRRIEVIDHVRDRRWSFTCELRNGAAGLPDEATVLATSTDGPSRRSQY